MKVFNAIKPTVALASLLIIASAAISQTPKPPIYPEKADAKLEIQAALVKAKKENKRVILDFGGNWCGDCKALNAYFHKDPNADLLKANFILVDVNIGHMDLNVDISQQYEVPLEKGVPALAVLDSNGKLLYSQKKGEFESMRRMDVSSVTDFLKLWKG